MITRSQFLKGAAAAAGALTLRPMVAAAAKAGPCERRPRAITMWDFSWLERRWPGAGYEDWDQILDELVLRGYDAIRIDIYPHLVAADPNREWLLKPVWHVQDWGAPGLVKVRVLPELLGFMAKCRTRGIKLGLSTWYREDEDDIRSRIAGPKEMAAIWLTTLDHISDAGLLDTVLYVDLCNEWPAPIWAPFVKPPLGGSDWFDPRGLDWMRRAIAAVRGKYPDLPLLFSTNSGDVDVYAQHDISFIDSIEHHQWMVGENDDEFYKLTGYTYERFSEKDYIEQQRKAEATYRARPEYWNKLLTDEIARLAQVSRRSRQPLMTTECWAIIDYKDWPLLPWDWVKDVCAIGTRAASATGRWLAIGTSNFCGPQFVGMWRDIGWHQKLTATIKAGPIDPMLRRGRLWQRL